MRVVNHFQVCRRCKVKHFGDPVVAGVELDQVLDVGKVRQCSELVVRQVDVLQVLVTPDALQSGKRLMINIQFQVGVPCVVECLSQAREAVTKDLRVDFNLSRVIRHAILYDGAST